MAVSTDKSNKPYNTASAGAKAAANTKRSLPSVLLKKKFVVTKVLRMFNTSDVQDMVMQSHPTLLKVPKAPNVNRSVKAEIVQAIITFYERDDVSRMSPNVRDCRKFKDPITTVPDA